MLREIEDAIRESCDVKMALLDIKDSIASAIEMISSAVQKGNKLLIMGNGGSAADAQHIAGELVGRFKLERRAFPAISLSTDTSIITAIGNDYSFSEIFSRQVEAHGKEGDIAFGISTSGNSENVLYGLESAKKNGMKTISLVGCGGGKLKDFCDLSIVVSSNNTPRIQESHITIAHIICCEVEKKLVDF